MACEKTAILWDVDGTFAPFGRVRRGLTVVPSAWGAMVVEPTIIDVALSLDADHYWFTNRGADEAHQITTTLELPEIEAIDTWVRDGRERPDEWPKSAALRLFVESHDYRRVVVVDDELIEDDALHALAGRKHLLVTPDHNIGVTFDEIDCIRGFIGGGCR